MDITNFTRLIQKIQELTDLELAMLLSFVAGENCIIEAESNDRELVEQEIQCVR